jgi:hypothetical protein
VTGEPVVLMFHYKQTKKTQNRIQLEHTKITFYIFPVLFFPPPAVFIVVALCLFPDCVLI